MSQYLFGAGEMFATPLTDSSGTAITNPTPIKLLDLQEGSVDLGAEQKLLYGQNSFPVAVGVGKRSASVKCKAARVSARAWNTLFFGQTLSAGLVAIYSDMTGATIPTTPFTITPTLPDSGTWSADLGVLDANGVPMKRVASAPATGEYSVAAGVYTFAAADTGKVVYISASYTATVTGAQKQTLVNQPMGYSPTFKTDLMVSYLGKKLTLSFPMCVASKMAIALKNEDFGVPEFEFAAFANAAGQVLTWSASE